MNRAGTEFVDSGHMRSGSVSFIEVKIIGGILRCIVIHHFISRNFCDDAGCRHRIIAFVGSVRVSLRDSGIKGYGINEQCVRLGI